MAYPLEELKRVAEALASKFGADLTPLDPDGHSWTFEVASDVKPAWPGTARIEVFDVPAGGSSGVETDGFGVGIWRESKSHDEADGWIELMDFSEEAVRESVNEINQKLGLEPTERDRLEGSKKVKGKMKFKAEFNVVPSNSRDLPDGYLQIEGIEDPGDSTPGYMNVQDWVLYRSNWLAAAERFPEGGVEGEAAFIQEHAGEEYPGDVVHENGFIHIYKGAASKVNDANEMVNALSDYPLLDESAHSELENQALEGEIDSWALDEARSMLGYDQDWAQVMTDEEAGWLAGLADADPARHAEVQAAIDSIFEITDAQKMQKFRRAINDGLTYGDWTVVHRQPMIDALKEEGVPELADPAAIMHQFIKSQVQEAVPGTKEYQQVVEKQGQQRLFESLRVSSQIVAGRAELRSLAASSKTVRSAMDTAEPVARLVGGHRPVEAYGCAFFTYSVKGQLVAASITAFPDQTFGAAWARLAMFKGADQAASRLAGGSMLSFEAGSKAEDVAQIMTTVEPVQGYKDHVGANVLCAASRSRMKMWAKTPKGFEPVVRELKKSKDVDNPWAVAWSMKNRGIKPKASADPVPAIEQILANDEASSDEELVQHFMSEMKLPEAEARSWVAKRNDYLKGVLGSKVKGYYISGHFTEVRGRSRVRAAAEVILSYSVEENRGSREKGERQVRFYTDAEVEPETLSKFMNLAKDDLNWDGDDKVPGFEAVNWFDTDDEANAWASEVAGKLAQALEAEFGAENVEHDESVAGGEGSITVRP